VCTIILVHKGTSNSYRSVNYMGLIFTTLRINYHLIMLFVCAWSQWLLSTNLVGRRWYCGHVSVHSCPVRQETVETVAETCDWALRVTSRSLWTTSAQRWCRLSPLHWRLGPSKVDRQGRRTWRPVSPTETRSSLVWRSYVMTGRRSLNNGMCV